MSKLKQANIKPSDPCANAYIAHACVPCDESVCDRDDALTYPTDHAMVKLSCHMAVGDAGNDAGESITWGVADTGASDFLHDTDVNDCLRNPRKSTQSYMTAGKGCIFGDREGELDVTVLNLDHQPHCPPTVDHTFTTTTVKGLGQPLWSLESVFRDQGYDIHLSHGYKKGDYTGMYRPPEGSKYGPESFIPMVYDWQGSGGWRVPYVIKHPETRETDHIALLRAILEQSKIDQSRNAKRAEQLHTYNAFQAQKLERYYWACQAVSQTVSVRVPGERNIRPAFTYGNLRRSKSKNWHDFHSAMAHMGEPDHPCAICDMYKGVAHPRPKHRHGKPRDNRPGHVWHMDLIVMKHRSEEGAKYLLVLTDECTQFIQLIPLFWKTDAVYEIERWIKSLRDHPAFVGFTDYQLVGRIVTDNESVWSPDATKFHEMLHRVTRRC